MRSAVARSMASRRMWPERIRARTGQGRSALASWFETARSLSSGRPSAGPFGASFTMRGEGVPRRTPGKRALKTPRNLTKIETLSAACAAPVVGDSSACARPIAPRAYRRKALALVRPAASQNLHKNRSKPRRRQRYSLTTPLRNERCALRLSGRRGRRGGASKNPQAAPR